MPQTIKNYVSAASAVEYTMHEVFDMGKSILVVLLLGALFLCSAGFIMGKPEKVQSSKPFFQAVDEFAADGENFYTLNDGFHYISKYTNDGTFQYAISFSSYGGNEISIDEANRLCRYDQKKNLLFVYHEDGSLYETKSMTSEEFDEQKNNAAYRKLSVNGVEYRYNDRSIINSKMNITVEQTEYSVVVEPFWYHILVIFVILSCAAAFIWFAIEVLKVVSEIKLGF